MNSMNDMLGICAAMAVTGLAGYLVYMYGERQKSAVAKVEAQRRGRRKLALEAQEVKAAPAIAVKAQAFGRR